jgi:hypothetical protein
MEYQRHAILRSNSTSRPNLYVVFKREFFHTFKYKFADFISNNKEFEDTDGESINLEALDNAMRYNCDYIIFLYPNETYYYYPLAIKTFCERKGLVRCQQRLNQYISNDYTGRLKDRQESTYSFPAKLLHTLHSLEELQC